MAMITKDDAAQIASWLEGNQFECTSSVGGDSAPFGHRQTVWNRAGTLIRLTSDRGQWWYDVSRSGAAEWLDIDDVVAALGEKVLQLPIERVAIASRLDDRLFGALNGYVQGRP